MSSTRRVESLGLLVLLTFSRGAALELYTTVRRNPMSTDADHISGLETEPALRGILALLVADRQEREDRGVDRAEWILARAGLGHDQIASITGHGANHVRAIIEQHNEVASRARPQSVIDRAREALTRAASTS
jgi:hypothetical protein